jgi:hypothetical protein
MMVLLPSSVFIDDFACILGSISCHFFSLSFLECFELEDVLGHHSWWRKPREGALQQHEGHKDVAIDEILVDKLGEQCKGKRHNSGHNVLTSCGGQIAAS